MDFTFQAVERLLSYIEKESFSGYDPYDALLSPLLNDGVLSKNKPLQFYIQQLVKRSPINLRPILRIPKGINPVTLGLSIHSYSRLMKTFPTNHDIYKNKVDELISKLKTLIPGGFSGACWGYDFPWQARYASIPAYQPTVVATGIITNGLFHYYKTSGSQEALDLCISSTDFVLKDLKRTYDRNTFCFSYSPFDNQQVYNASAKAIRILAQVYSETKNEELSGPLLQAVKYIINRQQLNGSWYYSESGKWVDNYHTGYVLDCLDEYQQCTAVTEFSEAIEKGYSYYKSHFFTDKGFPKLYSNKNYPVDCTSAGQSLLTLTRFNNLELAMAVAKWMILHMQSDKGYFYYRYNGAFKVRTSFMRWSNAWMLAGLSELIYKIALKPE